MHSTCHRLFPAGRLRPRMHRPGSSTHSSKNGQRSRNCSLCNLCAPLWTLDRIRPAAGRALRRLRGSCAPVWTRSLMFCTAPCAHDGFRVVFAGSTSRSLARAGRPHARRRRFKTCGFCRARCACQRSDQGSKSTGGPLPGGGSIGGWLLMNAFPKWLSMIFNTPCC